VATRIIVPHRGLERAKTRLAGVLDPSERAALAERLLRHVLAEARDESLRDGMDVLAVLHGDLPDLAPDDITALLIAVSGPGPAVAIAPDAAARGTNGLALRPPDAIGFHFGRDSLAAHRAAAELSGARLTVVDRPGLAFDVDTPQDLATWLERGHAA